MRLVIAAALLAAMPASAQPDAFDVTLHCKGELPVAIEIVAAKPGVLVLSLERMIAACIESMPQKSRWRAGA